MIFSRGLCVWVFVLMVFASASAAPVWTKTVYADADYTEVPNRLNKGVVLIGAQSGKRFTIMTATDGDITTSSWIDEKAYLAPGDVFVFALTNEVRKAVELTDVRIWGRWDANTCAGFKTANLQVKYFGSDEFVELPDTAVDYLGKVDMRQCAKLIDDSGTIAKCVTELRMTFVQLNYNFLGVAEIEVAGTPSDVSSPMGAVTVTTTQNRAEVVTLLQHPGDGSPYADFYFAYAIKGESLPEAVRIVEGQMAGETMTNVIAGLPPNTDYHYQGFFTNAVGGSQSFSGEFRTLSDYQWKGGEYSVAEWTPPVGLIMGHQTNTAENAQLRTDADVNSYSLMTPGLFNVIEYSEPKDIREIVIFAYDKYIEVEILGVDVKYYGESDYQELTESGDSFAGNVIFNKLSFSRRDGADLATNVSAIRIRIGSTGGRCRELCVIGRDHAGQLQYDFAARSVDTYVAATDWLGGAKYESGSEPLAAFFDRDISTYGSFGGNTFVWTFNRPHDLRQLRIITAVGQVTYQGYRNLGVYVQYAGSSDYTYLPGSQLMQFRCLTSKTTEAVMRPVAGKYFARNVKKCKFTLGQLFEGEKYINLSEIELSGHRSPNGVCVIFR